MSGPKTFDCIEMKRQIQRDMLEEYRGMPEVDARRVELERIAADPLFRRFVAKPVGPAAATSE